MNVFFEIIKSFCALGDAREDSDCDVLILLDKDRCQP